MVHDMYQQKWKPGIDFSEKLIQLKTSCKHEEQSFFSVPHYQNRVLGGAL